MFVKKNYSGRRIRKDSHKIYILWLFIYWNIYKYKRLRKRIRAAGSTLQDHISETFRWKKFARKRNSLSWTFDVFANEFSGGGKGRSANREEDSPVSSRNSRVALSPVQARRNSFWTVPRKIRRKPRSAGSISNSDFVALFLRRWKFALIIRDKRPS